MVQPIARVAPGSIVHRFLDGSQMTVLGQNDQEMWDAFVADTPNGHLLQCWAWGELKRTLGWEPLRIALWDADSGRLLAGAQALLRPIPLTGSLFAYIPKGPALDWSDAACCELFLAGLHAYLRTRRVAVLRVEPDLPEKIGENGEADPASPSQTPADPAARFGGLYSAAQGQEVARRLNNLGFRRTPDHIQQLRTIAVDLAADEQTIASRQKAKWRYNTNLAARKGITVRQAQSLDDLQHWYDLVEITRARDRFASRTLSYYQRAWKSLKAGNQAELFLAEHAGTLLAGIFVSRVGRQGIYLYGASSDQNRQLMPNHLLQWEAMRWAKAQGATLYDLWGIANSDDPGDPLAGVTQFKRGWGGKVIQYIGAFDYVYAPLAYRIFLGGARLLASLTAFRAYLLRRRGS
ncbi:MAG TPA: peptidoglycan bridge formation glycyltransferase FemA/FemB family protein [Ktedonobacterales bacterium]|jgi:lipid II:glycine glycyltransferase (peptidoglycan interpeptide bridge formation enzyme)